MTMQLMRSRPPQCWVHLCCSWDWQYAICASGLQLQHQRTERTPQQQRDLCHSCDNDICASRTGRPCSALAIGTCDRRRWR